MSFFFLGLAQCWMSKIQTITEISNIIIILFIKHFFFWFQKSCLTLHIFRLFSQHSQEETEANKDWRAWLTCSRSFVCGSPVPALKKHLVKDMRGMPWVHACLLSELMSVVRTGANSVASRERQAGGVGRRTCLAPICRQSL